MIYPTVFVLAAVFGWVRAGRRGGDRLDQVHYAAVHGVIFTLAVALIVVIGAALGLGG